MYLLQCLSAAHWPSPGFVDKHFWMIMYVPSSTSLHFCDFLRSGKYLRPYRSCLKILTEFVHWMKHDANQQHTICPESSEREASRGTLALNATHLQLIAIMFSLTSLICLSVAQENQSVFATCFSQSTRLKWMQMMAQTTMERAKDALRIASDFSTTFPWAIQSRSFGKHCQTTHTKYFFFIALPESLSLP
jgi:hypothetical protein